MRKMKSNHTQMKNFIEWLVEKTNNDDLPFDMSIVDVVTWVKQIQNIIISTDNKPWLGKHYGDCTKQNVSCQICMYQNWLLEYEKYCRGFF